MEPAFLVVAGVSETIPEHSDEPVVAGLLPSLEPATEVSIPIHGERMGAAVCIAVVLSTMNRHCVLHSVPGQGASGSQSIE